MSLMRIDDVNFSAVASGDIVEYDVSESPGNYAMCGLRNTRLFGMVFVFQ
jgi:hypothetical protein